MAEAIISPLIEKLGPPLLEKFGSIFRVKSELNNLCSTFTAIQAVFKDAEEQQWTSNTIRDWLYKLEDVAYEVRDLLDEFATEDLRRRVEIRNSTTKKVRDFFTPSNPVAFKSKMSNKVREVAERLDVIAWEKSNYNLRQEDVDRRKETEARVQTHSFVHESEVHGRKEDNDKLVHLLVDEVEEKVSIVPIVGMGGLGKTTLAKLVYNDERGRCDVERMESLQSRLRKTVSGKRYLLVLDDVWNENQEAWLQLKSLLNVGKKGSKIIATTRSNIVANLMGTLPTHHLKGSSEEDCWSLFKQRAFPNRDEETYPDLVPIGREIVKKCKVVPLVAKTLKLLYCGNLRELPNNMWKMISLRHLEINGSNKISQMPARISKLSDLQTLTLFIVSKENGIDELRDLNLRGSINIQNLQNMLNPVDVDKVGLREKHKLSALGLSWKDSHDSTAAENENCEPVIKSL
ncbi:hypothetical protein MRB53_005180 [Persea americana]|uniref:Uncharacterized protein n=2 Tax=Persea americana TaxID=3435 RepID=A0ACC2MCN7_PERAE|nr:hypothetical protein MRB53_005150 [Persea americana]KAJ8643432.1 hypothetical protein MRB53_005180 [Persea americana]